MSEIAMPKFNCSNCHHCKECYCRVFSRPVDIKFNRCFKHSNYDMFSKPFKVSKNLEIIMKAEEEARQKHYKGYLKEQEYLNKLTQKEIRKAS